MDTRNIKKRQNIHTEKNKRKIIIFDNIDRYDDINIKNKNKISNPIHFRQRKPTEDRDSVSKKKGHNKGVNKGYMSHICKYCHPRVYNKITQRYTNNIEHKKMIKDF